MCAHVERDIHDERTELGELAELRDVTRRSDKMRDSLERLGVAEHPDEMLIDAQSGAGHVRPSLGEAAQIEAGGLRGVNLHAGHAGS